MKNYKYITLLFTLLIGFSACSDELNDELFYKFAYFNNNGWQTYNLEVKEDNTVELKIYMGVNGTSGNDTNIQIELEVDPDTLAGYNFEKYRRQEAYYYPELPRESYRFDESSYIIPAGEEKTTAIVIIDMGKIDNLYKEYVLPVKIKSATEVGVGPQGYATLLANIIFTNQYSGQYSGSGKLYEDGPNNYNMDVSGAKLYATSVNSCFLYAGNVTISNTEEYWRYAINLDFDADNNIEMWADNPDLEFEPIHASMKESFTYITEDERYYNRAITLTIEYRYKDLDVEEDRTLRYSGTISITKKVLKTDFPDVIIED